MSTPTSTLILNTTPCLPANFTFASSTLYILLAGIGHESLFHWGYLLTSPPPPATSTPFLAPVTGTIFHITNKTGPWLYQAHTLPLTKLLKFIPSLLFILKLCPIDTVLHSALSARLSVLGLQTQLQSLEQIPPKSGFIITELENTSNNEEEEILEKETIAIAKDIENPKELEFEEEEITCRTWIKETLHILDDEGYISFPEAPGLSSKMAVDSIEAEAVAGAGWNRMRGTVGWDRSAWVKE